MTPRPLSAAQMRSSLDSGSRWAWQLEQRLAEIYADTIRTQYDEAAAALQAHSLTASAPWSVPNQDEIGDSLRRKFEQRQDASSEAVRVEAMRRVTKTGLELMNVNLSAVNPLLKGVLSQLGGNIQIGDTTRKQILASLNESWQNGDSIPKAAKALRTAGADISKTRSVLIARTELIGTINAAAHALGTISNNAGRTIGQPPLLKIWLTAEDERVRDTHADAGDAYGSGNGIPLDEPFQIGDSAMQFPGDQNGSPEEVCNCRCALSYEEPGGITASLGGSMGTLAASGSTSLPLSTQDQAWDAAAAQKSLSPAQFADAHFWKDPAGPADEIGSYKLPFAQVVNGTLTAIWKGVTAAAGVVDGARGGAKGVDEDAVKPKIAAYYSKAATKYDDDTIKPPWAASSKASFRGITLRLTEAVTAGGVPVYALADSPDDPDAVPEDQDLQLPAAAEGAEPLAGPDNVEMLVPNAREWSGCLLLEGVPTSDNRLLVPDGMTWRAFPLPLLMQVELAPEHMGAFPVGRIDSSERIPVSEAVSQGYVPEAEYPPDAMAWIGRGCFDDSMAGDEAMRMVGDEILRGVSADFSSDSEEVVQLPPPAGQEFGELMLLMTGEVMGATICAHPAFAGASIRLDPIGITASLVWPDGPAGTVRCTVNAPIRLRHTLVASAGPDYSDGCMVAMHPAPAESDAIAQPNGVASPDLHVTLAHLPNPSEVDFAQLGKIVDKVAAAHPTITGKVGGAGYFAPSVTPSAAQPVDDPNQTGVNMSDDEEPVVAAGKPVPPKKGVAPPQGKQGAPEAPVADPETDPDSEADPDDGTPDPSSEAMPQPGQGSSLHPHVALVDAPGLARMRQSLCDAMDDAGIAYSTDHDFTPHVTLGYEAQPTTPAMQTVGQPLTFSQISVHQGQQRTDHSLNDVELPGMTASGAGLAPLEPPAAWFDNPELHEPTPLTITPEGQIYGHLATWGQCHLGYQDRCVQPPSSPLNYALFHLGHVMSAEGELVPVGTLTLDTDHPNLRIGMAAARAHYDNTGTAAADIRCGEDDHGIWFAGAIRPDLSAAKVRALRAAQVSGDWRPHEGAREFVAALAVNMPGFPVVRPRSAIAASGQLLGLVAAGVDLTPTPLDAATAKLALRERIRPGYLAAQREALRARLRA